MEFYRQALLEAATQAGDRLDATSRLGVQQSPASPSLNTSEQPQANGCAKRVRSLPFFSRRFGAIGFGVELEA